MVATDKTPNLEERWLYCRLDKGMFNDEVAVTYPSESKADWKMSVFVPKTVVQGTLGQRGKVRVRIMRSNGKLFAVLPTSYQDLVEITESDLTMD